jgi:hypothetical protein
MKKETIAIPLAERVGLGSAIMAATMATAAALRDVATVWGFLGSSAAVLLALVFPSLSYVVLRQTPTSRLSSVRRRKATAALIVVIGCLVMPVCLSIAIKRLLPPAPANVD